MSLVKKNRIDHFRKNKQNMKKRIKRLETQAKLLASLEKTSAPKPK